MKKLLFGSLITLIAATGTPTMAAEVTPINLVAQGYQGRLSASGIPGYATFRQKVFLGSIKAEDLIAGAIEQGKLDADVANDREYINQVNSALFLLRANGSSR